MNTQRDTSGLFTATGMPDRDWWQALWPDPQAVLRALDMAPGMQIVDLCCGYGLFTPAICQWVYPGLTWAVDLNQALLYQAENACSNNKNFRSILGDARNLPELINTSIDFVFIANTFHGVPDKTALARAVRVVLNATGRFAIINWYPQPREKTTVLGQPRGPETRLRMQPEEVRDIVEPAGFKQQQCLDVGPYHYASIFQKTTSSQGN